MKFLILSEWEPLSAKYQTRRLAEEGHEVAVTATDEGPLELGSEVWVCGTLSEAKEFSPDIVLPMGLGSATALLEFWPDCPALCPLVGSLGTAAACLKSMTLSALDSVGIKTLPYFLLGGGVGDKLRLEAYKLENPGTWRECRNNEYYDTVDTMAILDPGEGEVLDLLVWVESPRKRTKDYSDFIPPIAVEQLRGLLERGGDQDERGWVGRVVRTNSALGFSRKVRTACQALGLLGLIHLRLQLGEAGKRETVLAVNAFPEMSLRALAVSLLRQPYGDTLAGLLQGKDGVKLDLEEGHKVVLRGETCNLKLPETMPESVLVYEGAPTSQDKALVYVEATSPAHLRADLWETWPNLELKLRWDKEQDSLERKILHVFGAEKENHGSK